MPRYPEWFKKVGDTAAHPKALDVGKKLLGYLAIRRETPGVQTLVQRVTLDDGTTVEASFAGDQPQVIVYSPDGKDACELYVESGLLDLGPNIAGDADKRFNRGPPEFGDTPATLYFGDGVDCSPGDAGLNGKVRVNAKTKTLTSECLPKQGRTVQSRLTDPAKKKAQAMLPASCWSGLMQRYVQAVYGGDSLDYSVSGDVLIVEGVQVGGIGMSVGLVNLEGSLQFVYAGSGPVYAANVRFKTKCGEAVYRMWKQVRDRAPAAEADKILTIALSEAYPDDVMTQIGDAGELQFVSSYGWQFNPDEPNAYVVAVDDANAMLKRLSISAGVAGLSAEITDVEVSELPPVMVSCAVSNPGMSAIPMCVTNADAVAARGGAVRGSKYEHPIACYFDDGLVVIYYIHDNSLDRDVVVPDGMQCGTGYSPGQRQNIAIPGEDGYNYLVNATEDQGDFFTADYWTNFGYQHAGNAITGVYARRDGATLWSTVEDTPVLYLRTNSPLSPHAEYVGGAWNYTALFYEYVAAGTDTESGYESGTTGVSPPVYYSGTNNTASYMSADPLCGRHDEGVYMNCGEATPPAFTETCEEGESPFYETEWTITRPISNYTTRAADVQVIAGAAHEIAIPRGDCASVACARVNRQGCAPRYGMDASPATNYSHSVMVQKHYTGGHVFEPPTVPEECLGAGRIEGESTLTCNGVLKEVVPYASGSADHLAVCVTCWVPGEPWIRQQEVAAFMQATTKILFNDADTATRAGGIKQFGGAGTDVFTTTWAFTAGASFEFLIDSQHGAFFRDHITSDFDHAPTTVEDAGGESSIEEWVIRDESILQRDFDYTARRSLLGAKTQWDDPFAFGASVNMDRETISGGYPKVRTPSFVGWA